MKLGVFDIEGTVLNGSKFPDSLKEALNLAKEKGILTTVMTGTGFVRVGHLLGQNYGHVVSKNVPIGVENGGRVVSWDGTENLAFHPLKNEEIDEIFILLEKFHVEFLAYFPYRLTDRAVFWVPEKEKFQFWDEKYGHFADVIFENLKDLKKRILSDNPCMVVSSAVDMEEFLAAAKQKTNAVFNEGTVHINTFGVNKGTGVLEISEMLNIDPKEVLIAGNSFNDYPMFFLNEVDKVFIGSMVDELKGLSDVVNVKSPEELGNYLKELLKKNSS